MFVDCCLTTFVLKQPSLELDVLAAPMAGHVAVARSSSNSKHLDDLLKYSVMHALRHKQLKMNA